MTNHRALRWSGLLVAAAVAAGGVALADSDGSDRAPTVTVPPVTAAPREPVVDWARPTLVDLGGGWAITDTEGDAPMLTVLHDGVAVGIVELLDYEVPAGSDGPKVALEEQAARFFEAIGADRAAAPIRGYRFLPDAIVHLSAADGAVVRYGFRGLLPDGAASERSIQWAGIRDGRLVLVAAAAYDEGGLFAREGSEFTSADLDAVADRLDRLVRASGLPDPRTA